MSRANANSKPPEDFDQFASKLWHRLQRQARRQGTWQLGDEQLLEALVRNVVLARTARAMAEGEPFVPGSKGQLVPHPGLRVADTAESAVHRYATALLLTPEARKRHGLAAQTTEDELIGIIE